MIKAGGVAAVLTATATTACGLLMIAGAGPAPAAADDLGEVPPAAEYTSTTTTSIEPDTPTSTTTTTSPPPTSTTTTSAPQTPSPVPVDVWPNQVTVGPGGTATISGSCDASTGSVGGPIELWQVGDHVTVVHTGVTGSTWSVEWQAPTTPDEIVLQPWCGSPAGYTGGYPADLQVEVVFVAQDAPATTAPAAPPAAAPTVPAVGSGPGGAIPVTG